MAEQIVPPEGLNIISSYGSYHVGQIIACILCGITTMQVYLYFWNYYEHDKWYLKSLVAILWALDIVNLSLIIGGSWKIQVTNWGSIAQIEVAQVLAMDHSEVEAIIILVVQLYLIRRIWIFNKRKSTRDYIILCILPVLAIWQLVGDIVYQIIGLNKPLSVASSPIEVGLNISLRASAVFVDLAVTLYMVRLLTPQADAGFSKTRHMVYRTILVIVNTGMFTAIFAATTLILLAALPNDLWYLITELPLGTCYLTCFLANLNTRNFIRGPGDVVSIVDSTFHVTAPDSAHTVRLGAIGSVTASSGPYDARSDQVNPFNNGIKITQVVESDAPELPDTIGRVNSITKT